MKILEILKQRRSHFIKEMNGNSVPKEVIETLIESAHQAPSHKLTYPWHFMIFEGSAKQKLLKKSLEIMTQTPGSDPNKIQQKIEAIQKQSACIIGILLKRDPMERVPLTEEICAVSCAVQNMYLALLDFEHVGGYWSTGLGTFSNEMHAYLGLKENDLCLGFFIVGEITQKRTASNRPPYTQHREWVSD